MCKCGNHKSKAEQNKKLQFCKKQAVMFGLTFSLKKTTQARYKKYLIHLWYYAFHGIECHIHNVYIGILKRFQINRTIFEPVNSMLMLHLLSMTCLTSNASNSGRNCSLPPRNPCIINIVPVFYFVVHDDLVTKKLYDQHKTLGTCFD